MTLARGYASCRFGQMHYLEGLPAQTEAPTLVLLHQNPSSSREYNALLQDMARDRRVIAFDTPGYGMSDPPPGPLSMAEYAAAFADAIAALAPAGPIDVYGFHTGALLAAELAIALPDVVARLAMTGIPMLAPAARAERLAQARAAPPLSEDGSEVLQTMAQLWDYVVARRDPRVPLDHAAQTFADKNRHFYRSAWAYVGVWSYDFARLAEVAQPAALIQPDEPLAPVSLAAARLLPDCTIIELAAGTRDLLDVATPQIAAALRKFLTR